MLARVLLPRVLPLIACGACAAVIASWGLASAREPEDGPISGSGIWDIDGRMTDCDLYEHLGSCAYAWSDSTFLYHPWRGLPPLEPDREARVKRLKDGAEAKGMTYLAHPPAMGSLGLVLRPVEAGGLRASRGVLVLAGWPMKMLWGWRAVGDGTGAWDYSQGALVLARDKPGQYWILPVMPLLPGLVVNVAFWSVVCFGVQQLINSPLKRWRRARSLCLTCGYQLTGLRADVLVCPECGTSRPQTAEP